MDDVTAKAAELGRAIRGTPKFRALREAEAAVMGNGDSVKLARALAALQEEAGKARGEGKEPDAAFKESLEKISAAAALDPRLVALARAQEEFQALVDSVSRTMLGELKP
jgi:cell fate (sporulation/competence/biofilm development) regulator YlbF (YheA/YmcA/DUF963 family)